MWNTKFSLCVGSSGSGGGGGGGPSVRPVLSWAGLFEAIVPWLWNQEGWNMAHSCYGLRCLSSAKPIPRMMAAVSSGHCSGLETNTLLCNRIIDSRVTHYSYSFHFSQIAVASDEYTCSVTYWELVVFTHFHIISRLLNQSFIACIFLHHKVAYELNRSLYILIIYHTELWPLGARLYRSAA